MESIIDHRIHYDGVRARRGQQHIPLTHVPPPGCLAAATNQITAAKDTRLGMHSSNCNWSLRITVLHLQNYTSLAKPEKP